MFPDFSPAALSAGFSVSSGGVSDFFSAESDVLSLPLLSEALSVADSEDSDSAAEDFFAVEPVSAVSFAVPAPGWFIVTVHAVTQASRNTEHISKMTFLFIVSTCP